MRNLTWNVFDLSMKGNGSLCCFKGLENFTIPKF
jgi:hypothetical protein